MADKRHMVGVTYLQTLFDGFLKAPTVPDGLSSAVKDLRRF